MNSLARCKPLLGTYVDIAVRGDVSDADLIQQSQHAFDAIERVQNLMSFHYENSELSRINRSAHRNEQAISGLSYKLFMLIDELNNISDGLFDPSIAPQLISSDYLPKPDGIDLNTITGNWSDVEFTHEYIKFHKPLLLDLGGIAKGFAVDQAFETLNEHCEMTINAGGDVRMSHWKNAPIDIAPTANRHKNLVSATMKAPALATSAAYFNAGNSVIVNPLSGKALESNICISIFADQCAVADGLTKIAWLTDDCSAIITRYNAQLIKLQPPRTW